MIDIEKAVLGSIIITTNQMSIKEEFILNVIDEINPAWFQDTTHRTIFNAIQSLKRENNPIDLISVSQKTKGIVEPYYIAKITDEVTSVVNINYQIRVLQQEWTKAELNNLCKNIFQNPSIDPFEDIKKIKESLVGLELTQEHKVSNIIDLVAKRADELEVKRFQEVKTVGERSGYDKLDRMIGGLVAGDLIVLAARPGMGKTAFAVNLAIEHCRLGGRLLMFSIEMPENQIADRVISSESNLNNFKIRNAELDDYDMSKIHSLQLPQNFFINDNSRLTVEKICASIRQMKIKHNLTAVIVDYLQLIKSETKSNREQEVAFISGELKRIAKECQLAVIALAQLSRKVEERGGNKIPMLSDLRESGSIEQDADVVIFPVRPQYYEKEQDEIEPAEIHIAKCRNGMTGFVEAQFIGKLTKYIL